LDEAMFSCYPVVLPTEQVNKVPPSTQAWLPVDLENFLCAENDYKTNNLPVSYSAGEKSIQTKRIITAKGNVSPVNEYNPPLQNSEAILHDQVVQLNDSNGESLLECFTSPWQSHACSKGITVEAKDSGKKVTSEESANEDVKLKGNSTATGSSKAHDMEIVKSPKTPKKPTDHRRRREKANEREKQRIVVLKNAMNVLRNTIPAARGKTKVTKLEVLKLARDYINSLKAQLMEEPGESCHLEPPLTPQVDGETFYAPF
jgi:hypothetical protein